MPPPRLRRRAAEGVDRIGDGGTSTLQLAYRPPYDWAGTLAFLGARSLAGIEHVTPTAYARTVHLGDAKGWVRVTQSPKKHTLIVEFPHTLTPVLPALLRRLRALFDLNARPDVIAAHLGRDGRLKPSIRANPGLRVPGAFHGFREGAPANSRPAGPREGRPDDRVPLRGDIRRADPHAVRGAHSRD